MQKAVLEVLRLGKLPTESDSDSYWTAFFDALKAIRKPTTVEEAEALLSCFHDSENEDAHGGAQMLMTKIESSGFRFKSQPDFKNEWHKWMWERQNRS